MTSPLFLLVQVVNLGLIGVWAFLAFKAIRHLAESELSLSQRGLWIFVIVAVPVLGAALYLLKFSHPTPPQNRRRRPQADVTSTV